MKKVPFILLIASGGLVLISAVMPMIMSIIWETQMSYSVSIIGGADGPTSVFVAGRVGRGNLILQVLIGVLKFLHYWNMP